MYTENYQTAEKLVETLNQVFLANKSRKTAKPLAQARVALSNFSYNDKFTAKYRNERNNQFMSDMSECLTNLKFN
jgi:hypothetical protein